MKTVTLESFKDEETGIIGLSIVGMPRDYTTNAASDGLTIAHDLIEHVNGPECIGSIDDELEALGAIWYVRGQHGELRRDNVGSAHSIEHNIASDIVRMFRDHFYGAYVSYDTLRTQACAHDEALHATLECADEEYLGEIDPDERGDARRKWADYRKLCLHRMRTGYRKARRKWERHGRYAANEQFWAIAEAVEPYAKNAEYEGARFKLTYGNGDARCAEDYAEDF